MFFDPENQPKITCFQIIKQEFQRMPGVDKALLGAVIFICIPFVLGMGVGCVSMLTKRPEVVSAKEVLEPKKNKKQSFIPSFDEILLTTPKAPKVIDCGWSKC